MTPGARHDVIRIGCAFLGAIVGRLAVAPIAGGPPFVWSVLGAAIGWIAARLVMNVLKLRHEVLAEASKRQNDTDFSAALKAPVDGDKL